MSEPQGKVLFRWTPTEADRVTEHDDIADEYLVIENPLALSGIVIYERERGGWQANPGSHRAIVRELLNQQKQLRGLLRAAVAEREQFIEAVRYWSYCTRQGMLQECPEKREELAEWLKSVEVTA